MVVLEVCCLNLGYGFCMTVVVSAGGEVWIEEMGLCCFRVNVGF